MCAKVSKKQIVYFLEHLNYDISLNHKGALSLMCFEKQLSLTTGKKGNIGHQNDTTKQLYQKHVSSLQNSSTKNTSVAYISVFALQLLSACSLEKGITLNIKMCFVIVVVFPNFYVFVTVGA